MKKNYESPKFEIFNALQDEYCAAAAQSVADSLNYKQLDKVTVDLDTLEDWEG